MTRRLPLLLLLFWLLPHATAAHAQLDSLRGTRRILLLFTPTNTDPSFTAQQQLLQNHASEISERDLTIIPVVFNLRPASDHPLTLLAPAEQNRLRSRYHIQTTTFTAILLGKDGGVKLRTATPVTMEKLTTLIDSMPMRQQEVRDRHPN